VPYEVHSGREKGMVRHGGEKKFGRLERSRRREGDAASNGKNLLDSNAERPERKEWVLSHSVKKHFEKSGTLKGGL